jgi:two-component system, chemotaxis family, sensor kinase CheA
MELSRYAELFLSESRAHISAINHALLELERSGSPAQVEEIFRAAHTLKGMSSAMGCAGAADVAHALEHLLDRVRQGERPLDEPALEALFEAADLLEGAIPLELAGEPLPPAAPPLLARLRLLGGAELDSSGDGAAAADEARVGAGDAGPGGYRVMVMIQSSASLPAVRAMLVLRAARDLGEVAAVDPSEEQLLAGTFSGTLRFLLQSERTAEEVREALLRAGDVAHVVVEEPTSAAAGGGAAALPLVAPDTPRASRSADAYVRIHQGRLDTLVERIGELVVSRDRLRQVVGEAEGELADTADDISRLIGELRDEVMGMRMVPIGDAFDRFPRFVRDAARALEKKVLLEVEGRDTPLDRSLHNDLSDLLIHLLRNALDHGVEPPAARLAAGKPEAARLRLSAERDRAQVVVRVQDDGAGVDRERVLEAAVERGMISRREAARMPPGEILQLLTRSGFSTAREVTAVSGRGVGLDVVASRLRALGGVLEIDSEAGAGTTFTLRFPLSLAIVRTLQMRSGGETYVMPIAGIEEVTELGAGRNGEAGVFHFREERLPLLRLAELLRADDAERPEDDLTPVLVAHGPEGHFALTVERLEGQHEAVLKTFDAPGAAVDAFAGATILADGRPALVLDPMKLGRRVARPEERTTAEDSPDPS